MMMWIVNNQEKHLGKLHHYFYLGREKQLETNLCFMRNLDIKLFENIEKKNIAFIHSFVWIINDHDYVYHTKIVLNHW